MRRKKVSTFKVKFLKVYELYSEKKPIVLEDEEKAKFRQRKRIFAGARVWNVTRKGVKEAVQTILDKYD